MSINRAKLLLLLAAAALTGCISLIKEPGPATVYALQGRSIQHDVLPAVSWSLTVIRPNSTAFLDSSRIAVRPDVNVLQVYQGVSWPESLPDLVQSQLLLAFENSGRIKSVSRQNSGVPADVALLLDIRQFESVYLTGVRTPSARIQIHAKLLEYPSNRIIATHTFTAETPAESSKIPDVVMAFESALNTLNTDMVSWALSNGHGKNQ